jgi:hypothetical protein
MRLIIAAIKKIAPQVGGRTPRFRDAIMIYVRDGNFLAGQSTRRI